MMEYKGYIARVEFDDDAGVFHGEVINLRDVITFEGTTVEELRQAFKDSVDDYLEFCAERNEEPEKSFSGKFMVRIDPELHRQIYLRAKMESKSLNSWVSKALEDLVSKNLEDLAPQNISRVKEHHTAPSFVVCIDDSHYPASLELHKIYQVLPDEDAAKDGDIRVIDESGEDYLYPLEWFVAIELPQKVKASLLGAS